MFQTNEEDDRAWEWLVQQSAIAVIYSTYDQEKIRVAVQANDTERVKPLPHLVRFL